MDGTKNYPWALGFFPKEPSFQVQHNMVKDFSEELGELDLWNDCITIRRQGENLADDSL